MTPEQFLDKFIGRRVRVRNYIGGPNSNPHLHPMVGREGVVRSATSYVIVLLDNGYDFPFRTDELELIDDTPLPLPG